MIGKNIKCFSRIKILQKGKKWMLFDNILSVYLIVATITAVLYAFQLLVRNKTYYTYTLFFLSIAFSFYVLGYDMELNASSVGEILFWNKVEYIGIPFVSALWLASALFYCGYYQKHNRIFTCLIFGIPIITFILRYTNDFHHLYFASFYFAKENSRLIMIKTPGPWMLVQRDHSALMILISFFLFIWNSIKSGYKQSGRIIMLIAASTLALAGLFLPAINVGGAEVDSMVILLPAIAIIVIAVVAHYDLLEIKSLARSRVFETSKDSILLINRQEKIIDYNVSAEKLFIAMGISLQNQNIHTILGEQKKKETFLVEGMTSVIELSVQGELRYYDITTEAMGKSKIKKGWIKTLHDITEVYLLSERLNNQATTDELSKLSNRRAFWKIGEEKILQAHKSEKNFFIAMMDLDYFKKVNDQYGHQAGDLVIVEFSKLLQKYFNRIGQVARLGGEEFALLIDNEEKKQVIEMVGLFLEDANQHIYNYIEKKFRVTVSMGIVGWEKGQTLEEILNKADKALYQSKKNGRHCMTFL